MRALSFSLGPPCTVPFRFYNFPGDGPQYHNPHLVSNRRSHHLQLQVVPVKKECAEAAKTAFNDVGDAQDVELLEMIEHSTLPQGNIYISLSLICLVICLLQ